MSYATYLVGQDCGGRTGRTRVSTGSTHLRATPVSHRYSPHARMVLSWLPDQTIAYPQIFSPGTAPVVSNLASERHSSRLSNSSTHDHTQLTDSTFAQTTKGWPHDPANALDSVHSFIAHISDTTIVTRDASASRLSTAQSDDPQRLRNRCANGAEVGCREVSSTLSESIVSNSDACHSNMTTAAGAPDSPPDLSGSRSSKSSSYCSTSQFSNPDGILSDISNFEDIGLDEERKTKVASVVGANATHRTPAVVKQNTVTSSACPSTAKIRSQWGKRSTFPTLRGQDREAVMQQSGEFDSGHRPGGPGRRGLTSPSVPVLPFIPHSTKLRTKSSSPVRRQSAHAPPAPLSVSSLRPTLFSTRSSLPVDSRTYPWQPRRKSVQELEAEYHDSDEDVPDEAALWNVPMSPRPPDERISPISSTPGSPDRRQCSKSPKPVPLSHAQTMPESPFIGPPRSRPLPRMRTMSSRSSSPQITTLGNLSPSLPLPRQTLRNSRAKSWTLAMSELSEEARTVSEALENHAEDVERQKESRVQAGNKTSRSNQEDKSVRSASSAIQLPPLQKGELDFLPSSKEKEAILSRTRPSWLPPKDPKEEKKHLKQYQQMMAASIEAEKRRESRFHQQRCRKDDTREALNKVWEMYTSSQRDALASENHIRDLWWWGVSSRVRGKVWDITIGNQLGLTLNTYSKALNRAKDIRLRTAYDLSDKEHTLLEGFRDIERDAETAFPELNLFQKHGPMWQDLVDVCEAFTSYRSDIGYVYGVQLISALLLLQLPAPADAFVLLANCLNRPIAQAFLANDHNLTYRTYRQAVAILSVKFPRLHAYLFGLEERGGLAMTEEAVFEPMFRTLFSNGLDVDRLSRVWDCWVFEGDRTLVRTAVALLGCLSSQIYDVAGSVDLKRRNIQEMLGWGPFGRTAGGGYWNLQAVGDVERWMDEVRECGKLDYTGR